MEFVIHNHNPFHLCALGGVKGQRNLSSVSPMIPTETSLSSEPDIGSTTGYKEELKW